MWGAGKGEVGEEEMLPGEPQRLQEVKGAVIKSVEKLQKRATDNVLHVPQPMLSAKSEFKTKSTVGIMLLDTTIDSMVVGGPAYSSQQLDAGDVILKIDGTDATKANVTSLLVGGDVPGSTVSVTVKKGLVNTQVVSLTRMATEVIADRRKLFEMFAAIKDEAIHMNSSSMNAKVDKVISLWTKMTIAEAEHNRKVADNVTRMSGDCDRMCEELKTKLGEVEVRLKQPEAPKEAPLVGVGLILKQSQSDTGEATYEVGQCVAGSPAQRCGLVFPGDVLQSVGSSQVKLLSMQDVASLITGPEGSRVSLTFEKHTLDDDTSIGAPSLQTVDLARAAPRDADEDSVRAIASLQNEVSKLKALLDGTRAELGSVDESRGQYSRACAEAVEAKGRSERNAILARQSLEKVYRAAAGKSPASSLPPAVQEMPVKQLADETCGLITKTARELQGALDSQLRLESDAANRVNRAQAELQSRQAAVDKAVMDRNSAQEAAEAAMQEARQQVHDAKQVCVEEVENAKREANDRANRAISQIEQLADAKNKESQRMHEDGEEKAGLGLEMQAQAQEAMKEANRMVAESNKLQAVVQRQNLELRKQLASTLEAETQIHGVLCKPRAHPLGGLGIKLEELEEGGQRVAGFLEGAPAAEGGEVQIDDVLVSIDAQPTKNVSLDDLRSMILGPACTPVELGLCRGKGGQAKDFQVTLVRAGGDEKQGGDVKKFAHEMAKEACGEAKKLKAKSEATQKELDALKEKSAKDIDTLKEKSAKDIDTLKTKHSKEVSDFTEKASKAVADLKERQNKDMASLKERSAQELSDAQKKAADERAKAHEALQMSSQELKATKSDLEKETKEHSDCARVAEETKKKLDRAAEETKKKLDKAEAQVEESSKLAKEAKDECEKLKAWLKDEEGRLAAQTILLQQALSDSAGLAKDKKGLKEQLARLQKLLDKAEEDLEEERRLKGILSRQVGGEANELKRLNGEVNRLNKEKENHPKEMAEAQRKEEEASAAAEKAKDAKERAEAEIEKLKASVDAYKQEVDALQKDLKETTDKLAAAAEATEALAKDVKTLQRDMEKEVKALNEDKTELLRKLGASTTALEKATKELEAMTKRFAEAEESLKSARKDAEKLTASVKDLTQKLEKSEAARGKVTADRDALHEELEALKKAHERVKATCVEQEKWKVALEAANKKVEQLTKENGDLSKELAEVKKVAKEVQERLEGAEQVCMRAETEVDSAQAEHHELALEFGSALDMLRSLLGSILQPSSSPRQDGNVGMTVAKAAAAGGKKKATAGSAIKAIAPGGPAEAKKLSVGDEMVSINGRDVSAQDTDTVQGLLAGPVGSCVTVEVRTAPPGGGQTQRRMVTMVRVPGGVGKAGTKEEVSKACKEVAAVREEGASAAKAQSDVKKLQGELEALKKALEEELEALKKALEEAKGQLVAREAQIASLLEAKATIPGIENAKKDAEDRLGSAQEALATAKDKAAAEAQRLQERITALSASEAAHKVLCDKATTELEALKVESGRDKELLAQGAKREEEKTKALAEALAKVKALEDELAALRKDAEAAKKEVSSLGSEKDKLSRGLEKSTWEEKSLASKLDEANGTIAALRKQVAKLEDDVTKGKELLAALTKESTDKVNALEREVERLTTQLNGAKKDMERVSAELQSMAVESRSVKDKAIQEEKKAAEVAKQLEKKAAEVAKQLEKTTSDLLREREETARLTKDKADLAKKLAAAEKECKDLKGEREGLVKRVSDLAHELEKASAEIKETKGALKAEQEATALGRTLNDKLTSECEALKAKVKDLEERLKSEKLSVKEAERQAAEVANEADVLRGQLEETKGLLTSEKAVNRQLSDEVRNLTGQVMMFQEELRGEKERSKGLEREVERLKKEIQRLEGDNSRMRKEVEGHPKELKSMQDKVDMALKLAERAMELKAEAESLQKRLEDALAANKALEEAKAAAQRDLDAANKALEEAKAAAQRDLDEERKANESLKGQVAAGRDQVAKLTAEVEVLKEFKAQVPVLEKRCSEAEERLAKSAAEQKKLQDKVTALSASEAAAKVSIENLKKELKASQDELTKVDRRLGDSLKREQDKAKELNQAHEELARLKEHLAQERQRFDELKARAETYQAESKQSRKAHGELAWVLSVACDGAKRMHDAICSVEGVAADEGGVGIQIAEGSDGTVVVNQLLSGGSAAQSGSFKPGDEVVSVNGKAVAKMEVDDVRARIVGPAGTAVTMACRRGKEGVSYMTTMVRSLRGGKDGVLQQQASEGVKAARSLLAEIGPLRKELAEIQPRCEQKLESMQAMLDTKIKVAAEQKQADDDEIARLQKQVALLEGKLKDKQQELDIAKQVHAKEQATLNGKIKGLDGEVQALKDQVASLTADVASVSKERDGAMADVKALSGKLAGEVKRAQGLLLDQDRRQGENEEAFTRNSVLNKDIQAKQKSLDEANGEVERLRQALADEEGKVKRGLEAVKDLERARDELQGKVTGLSKDKALLGEEVDRANKDREVLEERLKEALADVQRLAEDKERLDKQLAKETKTVREGLARETEMREEMDGLRKGIVALRKRVAELEQQLTEMPKLRDQIKSLTADLAKVAQERDKAAGERDAAVAECKAMKERYSAALADVQRLIDAVKTLEPNTTGGLGMKLERVEDIKKPGQGPIVVRKLLEGGAAERSGQVSAGDYMLAVNGKSLNGMLIDDVLKLIVGKAGTKVSIKGERGDGKRYAVDLERQGGQKKEGGVEGAVQTTKVVEGLVKALREEVADLQRSCADAEARMAQIRPDNVAIKPGTGVQM